MIRPYVDTDYEEVKINLEDGNLFDPEMDTREILKNKIKKDSKSILVAEINKKIIGNVYVVNDPWFAAIFRLAVKREYRGKNIGLSLMQKAEQYLKNQGHSQVMLFANQNFDKLIGWYKKQGYKHSDNTFKALWKQL